MDNSNSSTSFVAKKGLNKNGRKRGSKHRTSNSVQSNKTHSSEKEKKEIDPSPNSDSTNTALTGSMIPSDNAESYKSTEENHSCSICLNDFVPYFAMGLCQHPICNICALRLRSKSKNFTCTICKTKLFGMIIYSVDQSHHIPNTAAFTALEQLTQKYLPSPTSATANDASNNNNNNTPTNPEMPLHMIWQTQSIHFPHCQVDRKNQLIYYKLSTIYQQMEDLQAIHCPFRQDCPHTKFQNYKQLLSHLHQHPHPSAQLPTSPTNPGNTPPSKSSLCQLCLEHRPLFISEQTLYTKKELKAHLSQDHCYCVFCNQNIFDKHSFYQHLQQKHLICTLCDTKMMFRYYKDLNSLREHHRQTHYVCWQCDHNPEMRNSDISYAYRLLDEYCQHMKEFHSIYETSYRKQQQQQQSNGGGLFGIFSFGGNTNARNTSTAQDLVYYDLDVGSANPFPNRSNAAQEMKESGEPEVQQQFPQLDSSRVMLPTASEAEEMAQLIPPNMQIVGKVTGAGRFQALNQEDQTLQQAADLAHKLTYAKMMRNGNTSQEHLLSNLNQSFPSLQVNNTTNDDADLVFIDKLENHNNGDGDSSNRETEGAASTSGYYTNLSMKVGASKAIHPLSLVGKTKVANAATNASTLATTQEQEKKVSRALQLAEAFGITDNVTKMSETLQTTFAEEEINADEYKKYLLTKLPSTIRFTPSPSSLLLFTLYPMDLMIWGKANKYELIKIEKKFHQLLTSPKTHSVSLKPMDYHERQMMHILSKYYHCNSYEYDYEPKRYVSLVKTVNSRSPVTLLSDAISFTPPTASMSNPATSYTYSYNKMYTMTGIENPILYFVLQNDFLLSTWGKGTDNTITQKKSVMNLSQLFSLLPYHSHGLIVGELIYYLQEILFAFDLQVNEVFYAGNCYSIGIQFKDFTTAKNAYYYLTMIYEAIQSVSPATTAAVASGNTFNSKKNASSTAVAAGNEMIFKKLFNKFDSQLLLYLAYYKMIPDFIVNNNTKEEFDQYVNIFQEFIVVPSNTMKEGEEDEENEEADEGGNDAWDDGNDPSTQPAVVAPYKAYTEIPKSSFLPVTDGLKENEDEGEDDWEEINEWEEYLAEKRKKHTLSSTTASSQPVYQVKKPELSSVVVQSSLTVDNSIHSADRSEGEDDDDSESEDQEDAEVEAERAKQKQLDADYALALAISEGREADILSWQSSAAAAAAAAAAALTNKVSSTPASSTESKKIVSSTSTKSANSVKLTTTGKPVTVVKNRFNLLDEEDAEDSD